MLLEYMNTHHFSEALSLDV